MALHQKPPVSARAKVARYALTCLALSLLSVAPTRGESLGVANYYSWQWGGFSRTQFVPTANSYPTSLLAAVMLRSWAADSIVSESTVESSTATVVVNPASLSGVIYFDENQNGVRDSGDWAIRDAIVSLTPASTSTVVTAVTDQDGNYSFQNLAADDYTITLLTPSSVPGQINVGTLKDANGTDIFTGQGIAVGQNSIANIQLKEGYTGITYDFGQYVYPTDLISKRMVLSDNPGVPHTPDAPQPPTPPVPEPGTLALLLVAGLAVSGFARRRS
jgi:hypothetical protein